MKDAQKRFKYPLDLQLFAEGGPEPVPDKDETPDPPEHKFTQAELDAIVADRLARERKKYGDYDDLKTRLSKFEEAEEERKKAEMTETERLSAELAEAQRKATEAEEARQSALSSINQRLIESEFKAQARDANIPADRIAAALKLADLSEVVVGEDGVITGVDVAVNALKEAHPYLAVVAQPKPIGSPAGGEQLPDKTKEQLLSEAAEKARKTGRIEDRIAYSTLKTELNK